jgi:hypothetical protein
VAITSLDGVLAGAQPCIAWAKNVTATLVAGRPTSLFTLAGNPGPGTPNTGLTGANYSSSSTIPNGILYHTDPGSGDSYLARFLAECTQAGTVLLCDRLWDCGPATASTSAQSISQPTLPARDAQGTTNGLGVQLAIEIVAATSSTAAVISVNYTNSGGTASRTGTFIDLPTAATNAIGNFYRIGLQAGDQGVRSVQSVTFSTDWTSGTLALVAYRVLAMLELSQAIVPNAIDAVTAGFPQLFNGVCPFMVFLPNTTTASNLSGCYVETQG